MTRSRIRQIAKGVLVYGAIIAVTLLIIDGICIAFNLFPPTHNYGDPDLGWRSAPATGKMSIGKCLEFGSGTTITYDRNEDGVRTSQRRDAIHADTVSLKIGVTGDSHTDLCAHNDQLHSGVLEAELRAAGVPAIVLPIGAGKYSPLQAYLAFHKILAPYRPNVLILNVYTGNDFYDILRVDDRPHFVAAPGGGYRIADPVWFSLDDPRIHRRSRVLFVAQTLGDKLGIWRMYLRISELRRLGAQHGGGLVEVFRYMWDIWKAREPSVGYADAFTSQILNQQLFFYHFPSAQRESVAQIDALMALIRRDNPGVVLMMSPLPSYEVTGEQPVDSALLRTHRRLPISYEEGARQERALYEQLRELAARQQWLFVDNLAVLQGYHGPERLYNNYDYHLLPPASALIGRAQARVLLDALRKSPQ